MPYDPLSSIKKFEEHKNKKKEKKKAETKRKNQQKAWDWKSKSRRNNTLKAKTSLKSSTINKNKKVYKNNWNDTSLDQKPNKKTKRTLEKEVWNYFSKYIRLRDSLRSAYTEDYCQCITCWQITPNDWQLHAWHFIPKTTKSIKFNEVNVNGQCTKCNTNGSWEVRIYRKVLIKLYWKNKIQDLEKQKRLVISWWIQKDQLNELLKKYKQKYKNLKEKGITKKEHKKWLEKYKIIKKNIL